MTIAPKAGRLVATLTTGPVRHGRHAFVTERTATLDFDLFGIPGGRHHGPSRRAGAREPWLPRGTVIRNDRQVSALSITELAVVADRLGLAALAPEWLGGNLLIDGIADFSRLAPGSRLAFGGSWRGKGRFDGGVVLRVEAYNAPCRQAGRAVAEMAGDAALEFAFVKAAAGLRGLVLSVDRAGQVAAGDEVIVLPPVIA